MIRCWQELTDSKVAKHQSALKTLCATLKEEEGKLRELEKKRAADGAEEAKLQAQCDNVEDNIFRDFSKVGSRCFSLPHPRLEAPLPLLDAPIRDELDGRLASVRGKRLPHSAR